MRRRGDRRAEPRITDPATHPRSSVCLTVAAEWLRLSERTVLARIDDGKLSAVRDGKTWRIDMRDLIAYDEQRRRAS